MKAKKLNEKDTKALNNLTTLIGLEAVSLRDCVTRGEAFSFSGYTCNGDKAATVESIHRQVVTLRARLLELDKKVRSVSGW